MSEPQPETSTAAAVPETEQQEKEEQVEETKKESYPPHFVLSADLLFGNGMATGPQKQRVLDAVITAEALPDAAKRSRVQAKIISELQSLEGVHLEVRMNLRQMSRQGGTRGGCSGGGGGGGGRGGGSGDGSESVDPLAVPKGPSTGIGAWFSLDGEMLGIGTLSSCGRGVHGFWKE